MENCSLIFPFTLRREQLITLTRPLPIEILKDHIKKFHVRVVWVSRLSACPAVTPAKNVYFQIIFSKFRWEGAAAKDVLIPLTQKNRKNVYPGL